MQMAIKMERSDWLITILHSQAGRKGKIDDPIEGSIRLMKDVFLLFKEGNVELPNFYADFVPYLYGPCSFIVYRDLVDLKKSGLIDEMKLPNKRWSTFRLTTKGQEKAEEIFNVLSEEVKKRIMEIKGLVDGFSFLSLLLYVYNRYPEYMTKSIIHIPRGINLGS